MKRILPIEEVFGVDVVAMVFVYERNRPQAKGFKSMQTLYAVSNLLIICRTAGFQNGLTRIRFVLDDGTMKP